MVLELIHVHQIPCCYKRFGKYLRMHTSRCKYFLKPNVSYDCKAKKYTSKSSLDGYQDLFIRPTTEKLVPCLSEKNGRMLLRHIQIVNLQKTPFQRPETWVRMCISRLYWIWHFL